MNISKLKTKTLRKMKKENYEEIEIRMAEIYFIRIERMKKCLTKRDFEFWIAHN